MQSFSDFVGGRSYWSHYNSDENEGARSARTSSPYSQQIGASPSSYTFWPFSVHSHDEESDKQEGDGANIDNGLEDDASRRSNSPIFVGGDERFITQDSSEMRTAIEGRATGMKLRTPRLTPRQGSRKPIKSKLALSTNDNNAPQESNTMLKPPSPPSPERSNRSSSLSAPLVDWSFEDSFMSFAVMNEKESDDQTTRMATETKTRCVPSINTSSFSNLGKLSFDRITKSGLDPNSKKFLQLMHANHIASIDEAYCPQLVNEYNVQTETFMGRVNEEGEDEHDTSDECCPFDSQHKELDDFDLFAVADLRAAAQDVTSLLPSPHRLQIMKKDTTQQSSISDKNVLKTYSSNSIVPSATSLSTPSPSAIITSMTTKIHNDMHSTFVTTPQQLMNDVQKQWTDAAWSMLGMSSDVDSPVEGKKGNTTSLRAQSPEEDKHYLWTTTCDVSDVLNPNVLVDLNDICMCKGPQHPRDTRQDIAVKPSPTFEKLTLCEETLPDVFLDPNFDMSTPLTFEAVMGVLQSIQSPDGYESEEEKERQLDLNLQKKKKSLVDSSVLEKSNAPLNLYWDVAEEALREQVSKRSKDYFSENARFRDLEVDTALLMKEVNALKAEMALIHDCSVREPLSVPRMAVERENVQKLSSVIDQISGLFIEKEKIHHLVEKKENQKALEAISSLRQKIERPPTCGNDGMHMSKLEALDQLCEDITTYENDAIENIICELVDFFLDRKTSPAAVGGVSTSSTEQVNESCVCVRSCVCSNENILGLLATLKDSESLPLLTKRYSSRLQESLDNTLNTIVTKFALDVLDEKSVRGSANTVDQSKQKPQFLQVEHDAAINNIITVAYIRAMSFEEFLKCLQLLLPSTVNFLRTASEVYDLLAKENIRESTKTRYLPEDGSDASYLAKAVDWSQKLLASLVDMRDKQSLSVLSVDDIKHFYLITSSHAIQIGKLVRSPPTTFLSSVSAQVRSYFDVRHSSQLTQLERALEKEKWSVANVSNERKDLILTFASREDEKYNNDLKTEKDTSLCPHLVESTVLLLECVHWITECTQSFPEFSRSLVKKAAETLHKFNIRSSKVIFDLDILNTTGQLLSIDISRLAHALDNVSFIFEALPKIQSLLIHRASRDQLDAGQQVIQVAEAKFEKVSRGYENQIDKILFHVCASIKRMLQFSSTILLKTVNFDCRAEDFVPVEAEEGGLEVCQFFQYAFSNVASVHKAAYGTISQELFKRLFRQLYEHIDQELPVFLVMAASAHSSGSNSGRRRLSLEHGQRHETSSLNTQRVMQQGEDAIEDAVQSFSLPNTKEGKRRMLVELMWLTTKLNQLDGIEPHPFTLATVLGRKLGIIKRSIKKGGGSGKVKTKTRKSKGPRRDSASVDSDSETISTTASINSFARGIFSDIPSPDSLEPGSICSTHDSVSDAASIASSSSGLCFNGEEELL